MALTELEDTDWFPNTLRDQQLGYIGWLVQVLNIYRPVAKELPKWIARSRLSQVHDLCSGSGEPMISLSKSFSERIDVTLSDKYPPEQCNQIGPISYIPESLDILELDFESTTFYTMFNAFHHFDQINQREIVNRMIQKGAPFYFAEILEPNLFTLFKVIFINTVGQFFLAPFVRPFSIKRLIFTYLLPVNLLTTTYDGIISVLKSKNKKQYQTLLSSLSSDEYHLEIKSLPAPYFNNLIVIRGYPIHPSTI